jgi:hypothetical protein
MTGWNYTEKQNKEEFYGWLVTFTMPIEHFDYDTAYKIIGDEFTKLLGHDDSWWYTWNHLLYQYGIDHGNYLIARLSEKDKNSLINDYDWDGISWGYVIAAQTEISLWEEYGGQLSRSFIRNFENINLKRKIFEFLIISLIKWQKDEIFANFEDKPQNWFGYEI